MTQARAYQVSTTVDAAHAAHALAHSAVQARLAACGQVVGPIESVYRWRDAIETATEWLVLFKTAADRFEELVAHLRERHTYEVPEIIAVPIVAGNPAYLSWIEAETRANG
jgi:periplasmic divalent cation tolerance protein